MIKIISKIRPLSVVVFCLFLCLSSFHAQLLDNMSGNAFNNDVPFFNREFVKTAKILEINGKYTFKKQGDVMRETNYVYTFLFDIQGRLTRQYETKKLGNSIDTTIKFYTYDNNHLIRSIRMNEKSGYSTTYYYYDDKGRIIQQEIWRDIDSSGGQLTPSVTKSIKWNTETMTYTEGNQKLVKKVFNNYGKQYLESTTYYDSSGFISKIQDINTITRDQTNTIYWYNEKGYLEGIRKLKNTDKTPLEEVVFTYDKFGNVDSKKLFSKGVFKTEYQIIYSEKTGLLSSVIIRDVSTNYMSIIRFATPTFWDMY